MKVSFFLSLMFNSFFVLAQAPAILGDSNEQVRADDNCIYSVTVPSAIGSWHYYNNPGGIAQFRNVTTGGGWADNAFGTEGQTIEARYPTSVSGSQNYDADSNTGASNRSSQADGIINCCTVSDPNVTCSFLPIELISFDINFENENILKVNWITATIINSEKSEVEISSNGKDFVKIGEEKYGGNSQSIENHQLGIPVEYAVQELQRKGDYYETGIFYVRLKTIDYDGTFEYSKVVSVQMDADKEDLSVFPNPANNSISILLPEGTYQSDIDLQIIDVNGKLLSAKTIGYASELDLDISGLSGGVYFIQVRSGFALYNSRFVKE